MVATPTKNSAAEVHDYFFPTQSLTPPGFHHHRLRGLDIQCYLKVVMLIDALFEHQLQNDGMGMPAISNVTFCSSMAALYLTVYIQIAKAAGGSPSDGLTNVLI